MQKSDISDYDDGRRNEREPAETCATTEASATPQMIKDRQNLEFDTLYHVLYNTYRKRFFSWLNNLVLFGIVASGTAGFSSFLLPWIGNNTFSLITAFLATIELVFDFRGKALFHQSLIEKFSKLKEAVSEIECPDEITLSRWKRRLARFQGKEGEMYKILGCMAYNDALHSLGRDKDYEIIIPFGARLIKNIFMFPGYNPPQRRDLKENGS